MKKEIKFAVNGTSYMEQKNYNSGEWQIMKRITSTKGKKKKIDYVLFRANTQEEITPTVLEKLELGKDVFLFDEWNDAQIKWKEINDNKKNTSKMKSVPPKKKTKKKTMYDIGFAPMTKETTNKIGYFNGRNVAINRIQEILYPLKYKVASPELVEKIKKELKKVKEETYPDTTFGGIVDTFLNVRYNLTGWQEYAVKDMEKIVSEFTTPSTVEEAKKMYRVNSVLYDTEYTYLPESQTKNKFRAVQESIRNYVKENKYIELR